MLYPCFLDHPNNILKLSFSRIVPDSNNKIINVNIINTTNVYKILKTTIVEVGMKSSLATGNFQAGKMGTKTGISQVMNRLTFLSGMSHLRRISTPMEKTGKLIEPRKLHATQWGFICPAETPEGHAPDSTRRTCTRGRGW